MLFDEHRKLVGCDLDSDVSSAAAPDLLLTFALRVLNPDCCSTGDEDVRAAAQTVSKKVAVALACRRSTEWEVPAGLGDGAYFAVLL